MSALPPKADIRGYGWQSALCQKRKWRRPRRVAIKIRLRELPGVTKDRPVREKVMGKRWVGGLSFPLLLAGHSGPAAEVPTCC